ncbi:hypothetical protein KFK09_016489 [Dendrobium nobile]|uniref:Uncharacterized protein n=1 Tax=Dendrobium nobile TaxID=94219 RepID=A0A8T3AZQ0_DENNO|nr:hypothetical protein KFK09_016489 [Dendrobium nobile]
MERGAKIFVDREQMKKTGQILVARRGEKQTQVRRCFTTQECRTLSEVAFGSKSGDGAAPASRHIWGKVGIEL